jgi:hypothetical protein
MSFERVVCYETGVLTKMSVYYGTEVLTTMSCLLWKRSANYSTLSVTEQEC